MLHSIMAVRHSVKADSLSSTLSEAVTGRGLMVSRLFWEQENASSTLAAQTDVCH